jgi:hypothetical protein
MSAMKKVEPIPTLMFSSHWVQKKPHISVKLSCDPAGIRTQDPYIKSVLLYQLSYGILLFFEVSFVVWSDAKVEKTTIQCK